MSEFPFGETIFVGGLAGLGIVGFWSKAHNVVVPFGTYVFAAAFMAAVLVVGVYALGRD